MTMSWKRRVKRAWGEVRGRPAAVKHVRESFSGAQFNRLVMDWITSNLHPDEEIKLDVRRLRARARELARNTSHVRHFLNLLVSNVLGPKGVKLQAQSRLESGDLDKTTNDALEAAWREWAKSKVTADGKLNLMQFQRLLLRGLATEGEIFVRKVRNARHPHGFTLQAIDPDQIDEQYNVRPGAGRNEVRLGIEVDPYGKPLGYWISEYPSLPGSIPTNRRFVPADQILHIYLPDRANQSRGITWFNSTMISTKMLRGYIEAELVASRTAAAKMGFIQSREGSIAGEIRGDGTDEHQTYEANPGSIETLPTGYEFHGWDPDHPTTAFPAFLKAMLRDIASGLGVSYNALANDLEGVNYSSMRSGLLVERDLWRMLQEFWTDEFLVPVFAEWSNMALLKGALRLESRDFRRYQLTRWIPRGWAWVDPQKDAQAGVIALEQGLTSRSLLLAEQGLDFEEILEQLAAEKEMADAAGIKLGAVTAAPPGTAANPEPEDEDEPAGNGTGDRSQTWSEQFAR